MKKANLVFYPLLATILMVGCASPKTASNSKRKNLVLNANKFFEEEKVLHPPKRKTSEANAYYFYTVSKFENYEGNIEDALESLNQTLELEPQSSFLTQEMARQKVEANRIEEAFEAIKKSIELDPQNQEAHLILGKLYTARKQSAEAIQEYQKAILINPKEEEGYASLAREYMIQKDFNRAIEAIQALRKINPNSLTANYYLGTIYSTFKKDIPKAIEAFKDILEENPDEGKALQALGQLYLERNQLKEAYETFIDLDKLLLDDVATQLRIGLIAYELKDYAVASSYFSKILESNPDSDRVQYYLGVVQQVQKKDPQALELFLKIPPQSHFYKDAILRSAVIYQNQSKPEDAIRLVEKALEEKKDNPEFYDVLSSLYISQHRLDDAFKTLNDAIDRFPKNDQLYFSLGALYDKKGEFDHSMKLMQTVLSLNPKNASALNYVGYSYAEKGIHLDEALRYVLEAHQLKPNDPYIMDSLGWVYFKRGDLAKALSYLLKADEKVPDEPTILEHLGDLYFKKGNRNKAFNYYRRAKEILEANNKMDLREQADFARIKEKLSRQFGFKE
ncbi:MAG: tetratricopeptide repeat protein [Deltaproteobacteria bacterium]|nr:tetratricopeptide repeat protein [Deltaproteobacteria bacterium]